MLTRPPFFAIVALLYLLFTLTSLNAQNNCTGIFQDVQSSNIPNYSFEQIWDCPWSYSQMNFAVGWIQASIPTSDLIHFCGANPYLSEIPNVPLPLPDGQGLVGMLNLYDDLWLEYVGACPNRVLEANKDYTLRFQLGFGNGGIYPSPNNIEIALFGHPDCSAIPFSGYGCPVDTDPGWIELAQASVSGNNEWVEVVFQFTPTIDFASIVLGPACQYASDQGYFFMDEFILLETQQMLINPSVQLSGTPCKDMLTLSVSPSGNSFYYEWYKDGVLVLGADDPNYNLASGEEGFYYVKLIDVNGGGCVESAVIQVELDELETFLDSTICNKRQIEVGGNIISVAGDYTFEIESVLGCDSTIYLNLEILPPFISTIDTVLCEGEVLQMSGYTMDTSGHYVLDLYSVQGCDSTVIIDLVIQPSIEVTYEATEILCAGEYASIAIEKISGDSLGIVWEDGSVAFANNLLAGDYTLTLTDAAGCTGVERLIITEPLPLEGNVLVEHVSCIGYDDGRVEVQPKGGIGPYEIYFNEYPYIFGDSASYELLLPGSYSVAVFDQNGCFYEEVVDIVEPEDPDIRIVTDKDEMTLGNTQRLSVQSNNAIFFDQLNWSPASQISCDQCPVSYYTPNQIGVHQVMITAMDTNNCIYQDSLNFIIEHGVAIPNIFSPNGDGHNDFFYVMGQGISVINRLSIYSRNGAELFRTENIPANDKQRGWNGTFRDEPLGIDVYVYLVEIVLTDGTSLTLTGDVTLVR